MTADYSSSLPLNVPEKPAFDREVFKHTVKTLVDGIAYDDCYSLNTQSGTQWDGFRHVSARATFKAKSHSNGEGYN